MENCKQPSTIIIPSNNYKLKTQGKMKVNWNWKRIILKTEKNRNRACLEANNSKKNETESEQK